MIFLTGMMGCGKTTLGKIAAEALELPFYDTDAMIEAEQGMTISEIFSEKGEGAFRQMETDLLISLKDKPRGIVSTGGGMVLKGENVAIMKNLGKIIWINRSIEDIAKDIVTDGRPLLKEKNSLFEIYEKRKGIYTSAADEIYTHDKGDFTLFVKKIMGES